jgi:hypothetical protein
VNEIIKYIGIFCIILFACKSLKFSKEISSHILQPSHFNKWLNLYDTTLKVGLPQKTTVKNALITEHYKPNIIFRGYVIHDSIRTGTWKGFIGKTEFLKLNYIIDNEGNTYLMHARIRKKNGELININYSLPF